MTLKQGWANYSPRAACPPKEFMQPAKFERESYQAMPNNTVSILFSSHRCAYVWESADQKG